MKIQKKEYLVLILLLGAMLFGFSTAWITPMKTSKNEISSTNTINSGHYLYVATPGIRDYLGYGGYGLLVFDIDNNHKFVKRIRTQGFHEMVSHQMSKVSL